ncbi:type II secretion system F family protein [Microaerobacter geothermalis]|uniref:type II secretion system F family protein n=1 Tax=Microaerobacter geothermalis TaxID=674972 RepID=UPI001F170417|nr:type II secretion system F family protein [Microaerobacter geothermalis]MCF6094184.1 type II secretion system F family protein [Microaerobacter geothermalis]
MLWAGIFFLFMTLTVGIFLCLQILFRHSLRVQERLLKLKEKKVEEKDSNLSLPFKERIVKPLFKTIGKSASKLAPDSIRIHEQQLIQRAGLSAKFHIIEWLAWRLVFLLMGIGIGFAISFPINEYLSKWLLFFSFIFAGFYFPHFYLKTQVTKRQTLIQKDLPDFLDMLCVSVEAGLGFDSSLAKVVEKGSGPLAEEFGRVLYEMKMGKMRKEALRAMAERIHLDDVNQFVSGLIQADTLGVRIGNILRILSVDIRQKRKQRAEEKAMKAPIKILFPLVFFVFPAIFILIIGPAIINIMDFFLK